MAKTPGMDQLKGVGQELAKNLGGKALETANDKISDLTGKLTDIGENGGGGMMGKAVAKGGEAAAKGDNPVLGGLKGAASGLKDKITGGGGGKGGGGKATKSTNIVETIDVGVPLKVAYNQWTEFGAFPSFMKKVENVEAQDDNKLKFKAQIFLSHREWEATVLEQVPDERIVWRSKGQKGHVDGAVTFHEIGKNLTRILVVLEYYPQGLFEKTGNIWEAQGRRARAELRHFRRHVMTRTILNPDEVEGWRGTIEDGEVVEDHEEALEREEQEEQEQEDSGEGAEDEAPEDEYDEESEEDVPEDEDEYEGEPEEGEPEEAEDEYEAEEEPESEEDAEEAEYDEDLDAEEQPEEDAEYEEPEDEAAEYEEEEPEEAYEEEEPLEEEEDEEEPEERPRKRRRAS
ncbi:MAG TPA: SRPBCC family protein [Marmoricola sp.]|nr:SRPBCC family protein [Marmoricola sp.]